MTRLRLAFAARLPLQASLCAKRKHRFVLLALAFLVSAAPLSAQEDKKKEKKPIAKITEVRVGFRPNNPNDGSSRYKVGLWAPVYVTIAAGEDGLPLKGQREPCYIKVETLDSEDVATIYTLKPIAVDADKTQTFLAYVKTGNIGAEVKVSLYVDGRAYQYPPVANPLELNKHIYLTLGARLPDMENALALFSRQNERDQNPNFGGEVINRFAAFEAEHSRLPDLWLGYQGVDLVFLTTENKKFLDLLATDKDAARLKALAQYVRRGGRLVITASWQNQDLLATLLQNQQAWQPPVPVVPPAEPGDVKKNAVKDLNGVAGWANLINRNFSGPDGELIFLPRLQPPTMKPGDWEVLAKTEDGRPLIARMPYGLGSITLLAFSLDQGVFTRWNDRAEFLKTFLTRMAPRALRNQDNFNDVNWKGRFIQDSSDLTTSLQRDLDHFDVQMVPFGWVALFIVLYIIIVGPLDYVILRFVFKKLEWTWFTFPTVVIAVSVAAYFTAYALKGNDLKVNKVDIVDFDMRTDLDAERKPSRAYAYGQTFFTLLSPRIQNYTVGIEPNPVFWGSPEGKPASADQVSWLGRPSRDEPGGMGRSGAQGFFRRPYHHAEDATGLTDVPIPVWTTKSFNASWEMALDQLPFQADLFYHTDIRDEKDLKISGTLQNKLGVKLEDVWLFYAGNCFPLSDGLPGKGVGAKALSLELGANRQSYRDWLSVTGGRGERNANGKTLQDPTQLIKQILFHEALDVASNLPNHAQRPLDLSWRLREEKEMDASGGLREAILVARVTYQSDALEKASADANNPLPTKLWLGELPAAEKTRPTLQGQLFQHTFVRVLLPVRPAANK